MEAEGRLVSRGEDGGRRRLLVALHVGAFTIERERGAHDRVVMGRFICSYFFNLFFNSRI
jgi:hypothetical protein